MRFGALGQIVLNDGKHPIPLKGQKQVVLLGVLLSQANTAVSVGRLIDALWGATPPASAEATLRWHIHQLRRTLGEDSRIARVRSGYAIVVHPDELDANRFERLCLEGRRHLDDTDTEAASAFFQQALALWRGPAYADLADLDLPSVHDEAARLDELRLAAYHHQVEADLMLGRHRPVLPKLHALVAEHPLREGFRAQLMLALYRAGRQAEALEVFQEGRRLLADELGIDPGPELRRLEQAILVGDPALVQAQSANGHVTRPPSLDRVKPAELPIDPPSFSGRAKEIEELAAMLADCGGVVICGPGGIGKSALAVHVGHILASRFPDGQLYANLHGSTPGIEPADPRAVLSRFVRSVGADKPSSELDELAASFRSTIAGRRILIVLDDAASASQIWPLLPGSTNCAVIITSRRALPGGFPHYRLGPLPEAEAAELLDRLIGDNRSTRTPGTAVEIVRLCDRLPLALCVVGARLVARPAWPLTKFVERLRNQRARLDELMDGDRAVRASFSVSYQDLQRHAIGVEAARVFRLVGLVDAPDLGVAATSALADLSPLRSEVLLDALVEAQLMSNETPGRYRMHDLLKLFARECALQEETEQDRTAALRRVFDFYLATARHANQIVEPMADGWLDCQPLGPGHPRAELTTLADVCGWVEAEHENLLAVAKQAADFPAGGPAIAVSLSVALLCPLANAGRGLERVAFSRIASRAAPATGDSAHTAVAAFLNGLVLHADRPEEAAAYLCTACELWHDLGHHRGEAAALRHLGTTYGALRRYTQALDCVERSLELARSIGNPYDEASCLVHLGLAYQRLARKQEALAAYRRSLLLHREIGHRSGEVVAAGALATALHVFGECDAALVAYEQALELARDYRHRLVEAECLWGLAEIFNARRDHVRGREYRRLSVDLLAELGWIGESEAAEVIANPRPPVPAGFWTNL